MTSQGQKVTGESFALQSAGNITIHQGVSPEGMREIMEAIASQIQAYHAIASHEAMCRFKDFEARIIERFAKQEGARSEAFKAPDFQYLLGRAYHAYARSGDEQVRDTLVDLIARRSLETDRNRLTLSLNEAVDKSAVLTRNEFAALSLIYIVRYVQFNVENTAKFSEALMTYIAPIFADISTEQGSISYLASQGCCIINPFSTTLSSLFSDKYLGLCVKGVTIDEIGSRLPEDKRNVFEGSSLIIPCINDPSKYQLNALNFDAFKGCVEKKNCDLSDDQLSALWNVMKASMWSRAEMSDALRDKVPIIDRLFSIWDETPFNRMTLTSVGIAIAHANMSRLVPIFNPDLSIWIK